jgi:hypothetical protein
MCIEEVTKFDHQGSAQYYPLVRASPDQYFKCFSQFHPCSWDNLEELGSLCGDDNLAVSEKDSDEEPLSQVLGAAAHQDETEIDETKIPPPPKPKELSLRELQKARSR